MEMNQTNSASDKTMVSVEQVINLADMTKSFLFFGKKEENAERQAMAAGVDALVETLQRAYGSKRK